MKLFVSTPSFGGQVTSAYAGSLLACVQQASIEGLLTDFQVDFQDKESLINRARNRAARTYILSKFDKLLTIDADIVWTYEDFKRVITSPHPITGGMYPLKTFPVVANFNPYPDRGGELFKSQRGMDLDAYEKFKAKYADSDGRVSVRHVPTGFLCVTEEVFFKIGALPEVQRYSTFDSASGERISFVQFYPVDVKYGTLRSEDWAFCDLAREAGYEIMLDTKISLGHIGIHCFRLGQVYGEVSS